MTLGIMIIIYTLILGLIWCLIALLYKKLYGEETVICYSCNRKVRSLGINQCPKCKGKLYDGKDDYYK